MYILINHGVHQEFPLSPTQFNIYLTEIVHRWEWNERNTNITK